jgi:hypothetical protein
MKMSSTWKSGKTGKKKHRPTSRLKIRWELLGLANPHEAATPTSIETIREQVSALTRDGFGLESRASETLPHSPGRGRNTSKAGARAKRRGATE